MTATGRLGKLTLEQATLFEEAGYLSPLPALSRQEIARYQQCLHVLLEQHGSALNPWLRHKPHLFLKWVSDLAHHPNILDAVGDILGPNLMVWRSIFFIKPPHDPRYFAWHQDSLYYGLSSDAVATAWLALTDSTATGGCVRVVAGSHRQPELPHTSRFDGRNWLVRGQSVLNVPEDGATNVELQAGEFSLHHVRLLHSSQANRSSQLRAGLAIRYIATDVSQRGPRRGATLVRGTDDYGHFSHEPVPSYDYDPIGLRCHRKSMRRYVAELFREALISPTPRRLLALAQTVVNRRAVEYLLGPFNRLGR